MRGIGCTYSSYEFAYGYVGTYVRTLVLNRKSFIRKPGCPLKTKALVMWANVHSSSAETLLIVYFSYLNVWWYVATSIGF